jgi:soluble lytic murein transglycosylase-like protein
MAKRSLTQIEESLRARLAEADKDRDGTPDDLEPTHLFPGSDGWGGTRDDPVHQIAPPLPGGGRGSAPKPRVRPTSSELARHELNLKLQGQGFKRSPTDIRNTQSGAKVWRTGEPEKLSPPPQTPQEKMIAQAHADAAAGKPTLAVTDPRVSKILDKLFPEKPPMKENEHPGKATRTLQQIEEGLRARLSEQTAAPTKSRVQQMMQPMPVPKSQSREITPQERELAGLLPGVGTALDVKDIASGDYSSAPYMALGLLPGGGLIKKGVKKLRQKFGKADDYDFVSAVTSRTPKKGDPVPGMPGQYYTGEMTAAGKPKTTSVAPATKPPEPTVKAEPEATPTASSKPLPKKPFLQSKEEYLQNLPPEDLDRFLKIQDYLKKNKMGTGTKALLGTGLAGTGYGLYKTAPIVYQDYQKTGEFDPVGAITRAGKKEVIDTITTPVPGATVPNIYKDQSPPTQQKSKSSSSNSGPIQGSTVPDIYKDKQTNESIAAELFASYSSFLNQELLNEAESDKQAPAYTKDQYIGWAKKYSEQYNIPLSIVLHAMFKETGWLGNAEKMRTATSPTGARGVMQIQPEYAEKGAYKIKVKDLTDPEKNIEAGVRGLAYYFNKYKDPQKALAAYNAGEGGAKTFLQTGDVNTLRTKETRNYIKGFRDDVIHQLEKFYPKNKQKVAQVATDVLATAVGAGDAQAADERPQTTTKVTKTDADPNRVRKGKISIGNVVKNLDTGQYTDYDTGKPVTDQAKIANFEKLYRGEPEKTNTAVNTAGTDSFLDKVKRVAAGELTSQVFGGDKKPAAPAAQPTSVSQTDRDAFLGDFDSRMAKLEKEQRERSAKLQADQERLDKLTSKSKKLDNKASPVITSKQSAKDPAYEPGTPEYDKRMEKLQIAAGDKFSKERTARLEKERQAKASNTDKSADVTSLLQKDQTGLNKAKRGLSDFEKAFAAARAEQGAGGEFTWTDPRTNKTGTYSTLYKGEKPPAKKSVEVDQLLTPPANVAIEKTPDVQGSIADRNELADQLEIAKSMQQQARRKEERKQDIDRVIQQLADVPVATPALRTPEELASDELWKDIRASAAGKSSEELSAAAKKAMQELETKIAADADATTTTKPYQEPTELPGIELKGSTEPYVPPIDVPIDSEKQVRRQAAKDAADAELKESINTTSNAELHDILRLAGRLK